MTLKLVSEQGTETAFGHFPPPSILSHGGMAGMDWEILNQVLADFRALRRNLSPKAGHVV